MTSDQLLSKFNEGINWNAALHVIHRSAFTLVSFLLFKTLTLSDFSTWANIHSIVFLTLLLADLGFRKSIPRYSPEFSQCPKQLKRFTKIVISAQLISATFAAIMLALFMPKIAYLLNLGHNTNAFYYGMPLFITEGLVSVLRLIYHSQFRQKIFNSAAMVITTIEAATVFTLVSIIADSGTLLRLVLFSRIASGFLLALYVIFKLRHKTKITTTKINGADDNDFWPKMSNFAKHSAAMWTNITITSLSERNFMVPLLSAVLGPGEAAIFKVANDGALFFRRLVAKSIGTTDTSILTWAINPTANNRDSAGKFAFQKLSSRLATLCLPLYGALILLLFWHRMANHNNVGFSVFAFISTCYLAETIMSPFERVLEVGRRYATLLLSYIPYFIVMLLSIAAGVAAWTGLLGFVMLVHSVRLVSLLIMACAVIAHYDLRLSPLSRGLLVTSGLTLCLVVVTS